MVGRSTAIALITILFGIAFLTEAVAERRAALVIGNSAYKNVPTLANPSNDAKAVSELFKKAGFEVVETRVDLGIVEMRRAIRDFTDQVRDSDIAVIFFAGHGMEVGGTNYMIPTDAVLERDIDVEDEALSLDRIMRVLDPAKRLRLVILDACRDNPFARTMKRSVGTRAISRGLAGLEPTTSDTLVAFAAKGGSLAADGEGGNSPFTKALVKHIATPGLDVRIALGRVRDEVLKSTKNRQEPFVYGSLGGSTVALVPVPPDPNAEARKDYEFAAQIGTKEAWQFFLGAHSSGFYPNLARAQLAKLDAAERVQFQAEQARRRAEEQAEGRAEENNKSTSEQAQQQIDDAKRELEALRHQAEQAKLQVEEIKRQAVEEARRQVDEAKHQAAEERARLMAAIGLTPTGADAASTVSPLAMNPGDIARLLQAHLKRVGCDPGTTDGNWDDGSRKALGNFNKNVGTRFDIKVASIDALDAVRSKTVRVCPSTDTDREKTASRPSDVGSHRKDETSRTPKASSQGAALGDPVAESMHIMPVGSIATGQTVTITSRNGRKITCTGGSIARGVQRTCFWN
jgi:uncharacterized caspase-like protein